MKKEMRGETKTADVEDRARGNEENGRRNGE